MYTADDYNGDAHIDSARALELLKEGNRIYVEALDHVRDLSQERIDELFENGQKPFAVVVACSDSRVVPEHIFMSGLGELFVVRVAGNVIDSTQLASVIYACEHLHTRLVFVLGHTHCGAIKAALEGERGDVEALTGKIAEAIGDEQDPFMACVLNMQAAVKALRECPTLAGLEETHDLKICGGIYHTHCGVVDFFD